MKIATGHDLSVNVLDTVFKIFDLDGDNCLSHNEFLCVMEERVLRGLKVQLFFHCFKTTLPMNPYVVEMMMLGH